MSKKHGRENDTVEVVDQVEKSDVALREEAVLAFWQERKIFKKSLETPAGSEPVGDFVFYDGPPFATGLPHYGHLLAGSIKDAIPRFWTMNGYRVRRQWGWDCHGLPLENLIEKELGLATKKDIEEYGIKNFNEKARSAVMRYADDWRQIVPRMGRFVDMDNDYRTMDSTYTESVWWAFKRLHDKGLVNEGFKSMHLCPRCGTTLSNFEVNQGYKDIKDISVYVKLHLHPGQKYGDGYETKESANLLIWTTTPWTLPGNLAAAVHEEGEYVAVRVDNDGAKELLILSKASHERVLEGYEFEMVHDDVKGEDLVGLKYDPPFDYLKDQDMPGKENAWTIYHADYVDMEGEGTGAVHLAPAFGEEDMVLAQEQGVPVFHHVNESGHFKDFVTDFAGQLVKPKDDDESGVTHLDADIEIVKALKASGKLLKKENITHSYPHCWRCDTPLLNYATTSWFVDVPSLKDKLIAENDKVNWVPEHVGKNRFGKWLEGARDWAISRQRYWGAPLPIWKNPETGKNIVIGSLEELQKYVPTSGNEYYVMRHGESVSNVEGFLNGETDKENPVTKKGQEQVKTAAKDLPSDLDYVFVSPLQRTKESVEILMSELNLTKDQITVDDRIRESGMGDLEGKSTDQKESVFDSIEDEYLNSKSNMESLLQTQQRMGEFLYDIESKYQGKKILIVSHGDPLCMLEAASKGYEMDDALKVFDNYYENAQVRALPFLPMPHNDDFELDFHRPYIDEIELFEDGVKLERIPDVFDCWFESGSMPYAQHHYPFKNKDSFEADLYPANFIAEGLDQTRGWFYSLIVLGTALFDKSPYENVIVNGLVLAEDGKKMSKSLQNYPDPLDLVARQGADTMRFYLLSSSIIKGEDLNFSEKEVAELQRKNIGRLHNVLAMYEMFADGTKAGDDSKNVLDEWIIARLNQVVNETTAGYKNYELDKATRPLTDLIDDLSVWYLRRSRDRLKGSDEEDKARALATLRHALRTLALLMAPVMPFYAEHLWQAVKEESDAESVHLGRWPEEKRVRGQDLVADMANVRLLVTDALDLRTKAGLKVRQPLNTLEVKDLSNNERYSIVNDFEVYSEIIKEELNIKSVEITDIKEPLLLDTTLTPELIAEGAVRELMRAVQGERKKQGLEPADQITLVIATNDAGESAVNEHQTLLTETVGATDLKFETSVEGTEIIAGEYSFTFAIKKI